MCFLLLSIVVILKIITYIESWKILKLLPGKQSVCHLIFSVSIIYLQHCEIVSGWHLITNPHFTLRISPQMHLHSPLCWRKHQVLENFLHFSFCGVGWGWGCKGKLDFKHVGFSHSSACKRFRPSWAYVVLVQYQAWSSLSFQAAAWPCIGILCVERCSNKQD